MSYVLMEPTSSSTLMESMSLLFIMAITLSLNLSNRDQYFLTTFESEIGSPRLKKS